MNDPLIDPDHEYAGNVCTGFGGEDRCWLCDKPQSEHTRHRVRLTLIVMNSIVDKALQDA